MSLDVSPALLEKAQMGDVREDEFLACIRESLPYAWQLIADLARHLRFGEELFVDNQTPPPNEPVGKTKGPSTFHARLLKNTLASRTRGLPGSSAPLG